MIRIGKFLLPVLFLAALPSDRLPRKASLSSPRQGDVLQGVVTIQGSSDVMGFLSAEIDFPTPAIPPGPGS